MAHCGKRTRSFTHMDEAANTIGQFVTKYMRKVTERCFITLEPLRRYNAFTHVDAATGKRFTYDPFALYHTLNKKKMPFTCPVTRQPLPRSEIIALCALINKLCIDHKQKGPGFSLLNRFDAFVALNTFGECILMVDKVDWSPDVMHSTELSQTIRNMCLRSLGIILNQVQGVGIEAADIVQSHIDTFTNNVRLWGALVMTGTVMASEVAHFTAMMWQNFTVSVASLQMLGSNSVLFRSIMHVMAIASRTMSAAPYFKLLPIVSVQELRDYVVGDKVAMVAAFLHTYYICNDEYGVGDVASPHMQRLMYNALTMLQRVDKILC